ncbi:hypothetical protein VNI00_013508 [Paramarasmius palmivorus]|uniref:Uncharacterized protein n=1 Tax=Paramarasmius palmivorus TaxID=297713 RepID=A0AAW0BWM1_9AGAR
MAKRCWILSLVVLVGLFVTFRFVHFNPFRGLITWTLFRLSEIRQNRPFLGAIGYIIYSNRGWFVALIRVRLIGTVREAWARMVFSLKGKRRIYDVHNLPSVQHALLTRRLLLKELLVQLSDTDDTITGLDQAATPNKDKPQLNKDKPQLNKDKPQLNKDEPKLDKDKPEPDKDEPKLDKEQLPEHSRNTSLKGSKHLIPNAAERKMEWGERLQHQLAPFFHDLLGEITEAIAEHMREVLPQLYDDTEIPYDITSAIILSHGLISTHLRKVFHDAVVEFRDSISTEVPLHLESEVIDFWLENHFKPALPRLFDMVLGSPIPDPRETRSRIGAHRSPSTSRVKENRKRTSLKVQSETKTPAFKLENFTGIEHAFSPIWKAPSTSMSADSSGAASSTTAVASRPSSNTMIKGKEKETLTTGSRAEDSVDGVDLHQPVASTSATPSTPTRATQPSASASERPSSTVNSPVRPGSPLKVGRSLEGEDQ